MRSVAVPVPRPFAGPTQHADRALPAPFPVPGGIGRRHRFGLALGDWLEDRRDDACPGKKGTPPI